MLRFQVDKTLWQICSGKRWLYILYTACIYIYIYTHLYIYQPGQVEELVSALALQRRFDPGWLHFSHHVAQPSFNLHFFLFIWAALLWLGIIYLAYVVDRGNSVKPFCILLNQIFCICDWFQIRIIQVISSHFSLGLLQLAIALTPINCTQVPAPQTDGPSTKVEPEMKPSTESEAQPEDPPLETPPPDRNQDKSDWGDVFFFFFYLHFVSVLTHLK